MFLDEVGVENFRSIDSATLRKLSQYNLLIGQNNVGKSSLQEALFLSMLRVGAITQNVMPRREGWSVLRNSGVRLRFRLSDPERLEFIKICENQSQSENEGSYSSPFLRKLEIKLSFYGDHSTIFLEDFSVWTSDGLASIYLAPEGGNRHHQAGGWTSWVDVFRRDAFTRSDIEGFRTIGGAGSFTASGNLERFPEMVWLQNTVRAFAQSVYMSSALRFGPPAAAPFPSSHLWSDASNLIQVLETLRTGNSDQFERIEDFVHACLPNIQRVQIPWIEVPSAGSSQKQIQLRTGDLSLPLSDLGSGTEQLLILATILATTPDEGLILIEEPESHLHPSAQRFIVEQLSSINRQVLVSSHSSVFIDSALASPSIYHLTLTEGKTTAARCANPESLGQILRDIGAKNSDVLLSNAVCFVEDQVDGEVLEILAQHMGISFARLGISLVPMKGSSRSRTLAGVGTQLLEAISQGTPLPHVFIFDRDEWPPSAIKSVENAAPGRVHFHHCRELENLLLAPGALATVIYEDIRSSGRPELPDNSLNPKALDELISTCASELRGTIYRRRLRAAIQSVMVSPIVSEFSVPADESASAEVIAKSFRSWFDEEVRSKQDEDRLVSVINESMERFRTDWENKDMHRVVAPGEEILQRVFHRFGLNFDKSKHNRRLAAAMSVDDIDSSTKNLLDIISKLVSLSN